MIDAEKHYKHTLDRKYKNYRKKFSEDIQNMSKNNPYSFIILSSPQAFSFFNFCIHFKISSFEI
jgi:hypothetical protein